jgi:two-component system, NtrC family, sensor histidine kinase PilS
VGVSARVPDLSIDRRIRRLMVFRVVMSTTLLATAVYVENVAGTLTSSVPLYWLIGATYVLNGTYALALWLTARRVPLIFGQVLGDLLIVTGLVYLTGDNRGGFLLLYPLAVLAGSVLVTRSESLWLSLLAVVMYAGLLTAVRSGWAPPAGLMTVPQVSARALGYSVFITGVACVTVALVGSYFSQSLKKADERLERVSEEMEDLQELNRIIVESIQSGLAMVDDGGWVLHLNDTGSRILGVKTEAARALRIQEVFDTAELAAESLAVHADAGLVPGRMELDYKRSDGRWLQIGLTFSPLASNPPGKRRGYLIAFQDLTEIKRLEREVRLKEKLVAVGEMAAHLAHEIRNPLSSISGSAQVLMSEGGMGPEQELLLAIIRRESQRLVETLNAFLGQARLTAPVTESVDLCVVISNAVSLLRNGTEVGPRHHVELSVGEGSYRCMVNADQVMQVFWNLARNGLEAMPAGGRLEVRLSRSAGDVLLTVEDEGRGMEPGLVARAANPFESASMGGLGLGLAIVYRIVREHGGDIAIQSSPQRGTRVEVRLPVSGKGVTA